MAIIPAFNSHSIEIVPGELQGVAVGGGGGALCLEGETDTGISVCSSNVGSTTVCTFCVLCVYFFLAPPHSSGCVVNGSSAMSAS